MNNQVLSIEQMQKLIELGIDTSKASAFYYPNYGDYYNHPITKKYVRDIKGYNPYPSFVNGDRTLKDLNPDLFPTFTLQDILEILPQSFYVEKNTTSLDKKAFLQINKTAGGGYSIAYEQSWDKDGKLKMRMHGQQLNTSLLEAAFELLKWVKLNNYM